MGRSHQSMAILRQALHCNSRTQQFPSSTTISLAQMSELLAFPPKVPGKCGMRGTLTVKRTQIAGNMSEIWKFEKKDEEGTQIFALISTFTRHEETPARNSGLSATFFPTDNSKKKTLNKHFNFSRVYNVKERFQLFKATSESTS